jgi:putative transposase
VIVLTGIRYKAYPTSHQAEIFSQWVGCAKLIWNAKCQEDKYLRTFARKYLPVGTFPEIDQSYSVYKTELTPFLKDCPSQILRNSAVNWYQTYQNFFKGICGRPVVKKKGRVCSIWLTNELFSIKKYKRHCVLRIGTKTNDMGILRLSWHRKPKTLPKSIRLRMEHGQWFVSFCYEDNMPSEKLQTTAQHLKHLQQCSQEELVRMVVGVDRGIARPVQTQETTYSFDGKAIAKQKHREKKIKRLQRKAARQRTAQLREKRKPSKRQGLVHKKIARLHGKSANIRKDFLHKTSRALVDSCKVLVFEELKLSNMTKRPKPQFDVQTGRFVKNNAAQKSGLNKALLGIGLSTLETFVTYKAHAANVPFFKVSPINTSRECASCGHIHPENRQSQAIFVCQSCGFRANADVNAAMVIARRAIFLILNSGTELGGTNGNILRPRTHVNRRKTPLAKAKRATGCVSKEITA